MFFPPSVFDIQVHLIVHLVDDIEYTGLVHYRWMYFVERFLKQLKGYVRNMALPEGSIAEGHLVYEAMYYLTEYVEKTDPFAKKL